LNNSIVVDQFVQLRKQILEFFSPVRTYKDANGGFNLNWACREFLLFSSYKIILLVNNYIAWALHCAVPGTSIWRVVPWHKLW